MLFDHSTEELEQELARRRALFQRKDTLEFRYQNGTATLVKVHPELIREKHHGKVFFLDEDGSVFADSPESMAERFEGKHSASAFRNVVSG